MDIFDFAAIEEIKEAGAGERVLAFGERGVLDAMVEGVFLLDGFDGDGLAGGIAVVAVAGESALGGAGADGYGAVASADGAGGFEVGTGAGEFDGAGDHACRLGGEAGAFAVDSQGEVIGGHLESAEGRAEEGDFDNQVVVGDEGSLRRGEGMDQVFGGQGHGAKLRLDGVVGGLGSGRGLGAKQGKCAQKQSESHNRPQSYHDLTDVAGTNFRYCKPKPYLALRGLLSVHGPKAPLTLSLMSWSSDIRCLYCDGKLPLYRKITSGQFCSAPHRKLYWQEQERLGVERLHQTHDSLRAFRPPEGVEAILGTPLPEAPPAPPPPSGMISSTVQPKHDESPSLIAADPFSYEAELAPQTPFWAPQILSDHEGYLDEEAPAPMAGLFAIHSRPQPRWPMDRLVVPDPNPLATSGPIWIPLRSIAALKRELTAAGATAILLQPSHYEGTRKVEPMHPAMQPTRDVEHAAAPTGSAMAADADGDIPRAEKLLALAAFAAHENSSNPTRRDPWPAAPFAKVQRAHLPMATMERNVKMAPAVPRAAGLRSLSIDQVPLVHGTWIDSLRAMGAEGESPRFELSTPAMRPRLRLAAGSRYPVATRDQGVAVATIEPRDLQPAGRGIAIPESQAMTMAAAASSTSQNIPNEAGLIPLAAMKPNEPVAQPAPSQSVNLPQPLRTEPMRPASHLEPLDAKPVADFMAAPPVVEEKKQELPVESFGPPPANESDEVTPWLVVSGFWKNAPRDLKLLVFGIPILLALALHPSLKKISVSAPQQANGIQKNIEHNFQSKMNEQWKTVKQTMVDRAAIALDEDFRAGLDDWTSRGGTTEWAFDATGFVRPGPLALYRPSVDLTDYQLQFLGMIDKKALSWVVRAADFDDYYVVKLVVLKPGPVPTVGITRYAVIHGVAQDRSDTTAFINAREDMLYRVRMDIHGDTFALTVQGQLVDSWSETRLRKGGVGFFTARGEASRLRWVQVTHQYDMLGRLCAYLAPYDIPSTNGGWQP